MADVRDITEVTIVAEPTGEENLIAETNGGVIRIPSANFSGGGGSETGLEIAVLAYIPDPTDVSDATLSIESDLTFNDLSSRLDSYEDINISVKAYIYDEDYEAFGPVALKILLPVLCTMSAEMAPSIDLPKAPTILIMDRDRMSCIIAIQEGQDGELIAQLIAVGG